jgi:periplasmic nitrate reductase NapD
LHISSIVVHAEPAAVASVRALIEAVSGLEVHAATDDGKLVVTIEAASDHDSITHVDAVRALPGVLAVAMVFHQFEPDPEQELT